MSSFIAYFWVPKPWGVCPYMYISINNFSFNFFSAYSLMLTVSTESSLSFCVCVV